MWLFFCFLCMVSFTVAEMTRLAREGEGFMASHRFEDVADSGTVRLFFDNVSGPADVFNLFLTPGGDARLTVKKNVSVDSSGSAATQANKRSNVSDTGGVDVLFGGSYSGGSVVLESFLSGGEKKTSAGAAAGIPSFVVDEGDNFLIEVTNVSGGINDFSVFTEYHQPVNL